MANIGMNFLKISGDGGASLLQKIASGHYHEPSEEESYDDNAWRFEKLTGLRWQWFDDDDIDVENTKMIFSTAGSLPWEWFQFVACEFPNLTIELLYRAEHNDELVLLRSCPGSVTKEHFSLPVRTEEEEAAADYPGAPRDTDSWNWWKQPLGTPLPERWLSERLMTPVGTEMTEEELLQERLGQPRGGEPVEEAADGIWQKYLCDCGECEDADEMWKINELCENSLVCSYYLSDAPCGPWLFETHERGLAERYGFHYNPKPLYSNWMLARFNRA